MINNFDKKLLIKNNLEPIFWGQKMTKKIGVTKRIKAVY